MILSTENKHLLESFRYYTRHTGYSEDGQKSMAACVREFLSRMEQQGKHLQQLQPGDITGHYVYLQERPNQARPGTLSDSMVNTHIYSLRVFFHYLQQAGELETNPLGNLSFPQPKSKKRIILSQAETKKLYAACETLRDKSILGLLYGCGLRISEAEALNRKDIDFTGRMLYVREGKGRKRRAVPLNGFIESDFRGWYYGERPGYLKSGENPTAFILNKAGRRMRATSCRRRLKYLLEKAGLNKEISPHCLRHSIATHLLENGVNIELVRDFLGHSHLETTQIYTHISKLKL